MLFYNPSQADNSLPLKSADAQIVVDLSSGLFIVCYLVGIRVSYTAM